MEKKKWPAFFVVLFTAKSQHFDRNSYVFKSQYALRCGQTFWELERAGKTSKNVVGITKLAGRFAKGLEFRAEFLALLSISLSSFYFSPLKCVIDEERCRTKSICTVQNCLEWIEWDWVLNYLLLVNCLEKVGDLHVLSISLCQTGKKPIKWKKKRKWTF